MRLENFRSIGSHTKNNAPIPRDQYIIEVPATNLGSCFWKLCFDSCQSEKLQDFCNSQVNAGRGKRGVESNMRVVNLRVGCYASNQQMSYLWGTCMNHMDQLYTNNTTPPQDAQQQCFCQSCHRGSCFIFCWKRWDQQQHWLWIATNVPATSSIACENDAQKFEWCKCNITHPEGSTTMRQWMLLLFYIGQCIWHSTCILK